MSESYRSRSADVGRLGEPRESSSPPQRGTSRVVDTMLFARFELPDTITRDEDISNLCSDNLVMKKGEGRLSRNNVMNAPRWANPAGMGLMERFDNLDKEISTLKTEVSSLKTEGTSLKAEVSSLTAEGTSLKAEVSSLKVEGHNKNQRLEELEAAKGNHEAQIQDLKASSDSYLDIRKRFFSVYIREKLGRDHLTDEDKNIISTGDEKAHHGDPLVDAAIYRNNIRTDVKHFEQLYHFKPDIILDKLDPNRGNVQKPLLILRTHATIKADYMIYEEPDDAFYKAFDSFVKAWQSGGFQTDYPLDGSCPESKAHIEFLGEFKKIPTKKEAKKAKKEQGQGGKS